MNESFRPEELLPHRGPMLLLDEVVKVGERSARAAVNHSLPTMFCDAEGNTPSWVGLEYMAQCVGLVNGYRQQKDGLTPKLAFLLGARSYSASCKSFSAGQRVFIQVDTQFFDDETGIAVIDCHISDDSKVLATASIKAIAPDDPLSLLR